MDAEFDDLFVFMPSFLLQESGQLDEGKALASAQQQDLILLQRVGKLLGHNVAEFAKERKVGQSVGKRRLKQVQDDVRKDIARAIHQFGKHKLTEQQFRKKVRNRMKVAWKDVFLAGLRSGGASGQGAGSGKPLVRLGPGDDKWLRSAMQHETTYLNRFLDAIIDETYRMPLEQRLAMYVDALESFYDSARVISLPATTLLYWTGPNDRITCPSCRFMFESSPFTKFNIPTTPRSGLTLCLCLTDCHVDIVSKRGTIPFKDVRVGDEVWTHRRRWRRVTHLYENRSVVQHRFAVIVGNDGRLFGVTDDHQVFTEAGWITARDAAHRNLRVLQYVHWEEKQNRTMPGVFIEAISDEVDRRGTPVSRGAQANISRLDVGEFQDSPKWSLHELLLVERSEAVYLPRSMGLDHKPWADTERVRCSPRRRGFYERRDRELVIENSTGARATSCLCGAFGQEQVAVLFGRLEKSEVQRWADSQEAMPVLRRDLSCLPQCFAVETQEVLQYPLSRCLETESRDPSVRLLREEFYEKAERRHEVVEVGQVLLLSTVLPEGSPLYDLEVEDDHSFIAGGLVVHNSNCRDRIMVRASPLKDVTEREAEMPPRDVLLSRLRRIKRTGRG